MVISSSGLIGIHLQAQSNGQVGGSTYSRSGTNLSGPSNAVKFPSNLEPVSLPSFPFHDLNGRLSIQAPAAAGYFPDNVFHYGNYYYLVTSAQNGSTYLEIRSDNMSISNVIFISNMQAEAAEMNGGSLLISTYSYSSGNYTFYNFEYQNGIVTNISANQNISGFQDQIVGGYYEDNFVIFVSHSAPFSAGSFYLYFYNISSGEFVNETVLEPKGYSFSYAAGNDGDLVIAGDNGSNMSIFAVSVSSGNVISSAFYNVSGTMAASPTDAVYLNGDVYVGGDTFVEISGIEYTENTPLYVFNETAGIFVNYTSIVKGMGEMVTSGIASLGNSIIFPTVSFYYNTTTFASTTTGNYLYRAYPNRTAVNLSRLIPPLFDSSTISSDSSSAMIFGTNLYNDTLEYLTINSNLTAYLLYGPSDTVGHSNPSYWTANIYDTSGGFLVTGGDGFFGFNNGSFFAPGNESNNPGFFTGAAQLGNMIYVTGQLYAPGDGALLYQYNLSSSLIGIISDVPGSLGYHASFLQDVAVGENLYILGETGENTNESPALILYEYNVTTGAFLNLTGNIPAQYSSIYFGNMVYSSGQLYLIVTGQNGTNFFSLNITTHRLTVLTPDLIQGYNLSPGYEYVSSKDQLVVHGENLYIAGNAYGSNKISVFEYNVSDSTSTDLSGYMENYSAQITSATYFNGMIVMGGVSGADPVIFGLQVSGGHQVLNIGQNIPTDFGSVNAISANSSSIFFASGSFGNTNYGIIGDQEEYSYPVVFGETGLPAGMQWSTTVDNKQIYTNGDYTVYYLPNGTYEYTIAKLNNFISNPETGVIAVSGNSVQVPVSWARSSYSVTFSEAGLGIGSQWAVTLGSQIESSTSSDIIFNVANGTYSFSIASVGSDIAYPGSGNITVSGNSITSDVIFLTPSAISRGYAEVNESSAYGSAGLFWGSQAAAGNGSAGITGGNGFFLANAAGNPVVVIPADAGYESFVDWTGNSYVVGGNYYNPSGGVTLYQYYPENSTLKDLTGILPTNWTASGSGYTLLSMSYGSGMILVVKDNLFTGMPAIGVVNNGVFVNLTSYFRGLASQEYFTGYGDGNFLIAGNSNAYILNASTFTVSPVESYSSGTISNGLGVNNQIAWNGSAFLLSMGSDIYSVNPVRATETLLAHTSGQISLVSEIEGNTILGTYSGSGTTLYRLAGSSLSSPIITVNGEATSIVRDGSGYLITGSVSGPSAVAVFYQPISSTTLDSQGLPSGTGYNIASGGVSQHFTTSPVTIYSSTAENYSVTAPEGYSVSPDYFASGSPSLMNITLKQNLVFRAEATYVVTFSENGLPSGGEWNATIGGRTYSSESGSISVQEINGSYIYQISSGNSYSAFPSSGTVNVDGSDVTVPAVNFSNTGNYKVTFSETGLQPGTGWSVIFNGVKESSTSSQISFTSVAGTFAYSVSTVPGYSAEETVGNIAVSGNVNQSVLFFPTGTDVTFIETGLPGNQAWGISISGSFYPANGQSVIVVLPSGIYSYNVSSVNGYLSNVTSGQITVGSSQVNVYIGFTSVAEYAVSFDENGLHSGSVWSVYFDGSSMHSNTSTITASVPNGFYNFSIGAMNGYVSNISSGYLTVNGTSLAIGVNFTYEYNTNGSSTDPSVTFTESGLQAGSFWSVTLDGTTRISGTGIAVFSVIPGHYSYTVTSSGGYVARVDAGSIFITSDPVNVNVSFVPLIYEKLYVNESGAPSNVPWTIQIAGSQYTMYGSTVLLLPSGTYQYTINPPTGYVTPGSSGYVSVDTSGASNVSVYFIKSDVFPAVFTETGLSGSSPWGVEINGNVYTSSSETLTLSLTNGSYGYTMIAPSGFIPAVTSGTIHINGSPFTNALTFSQPVYVAGFSERGLPSGTTWSIEVQGKVYNSSANKIYIPLPSGTYSYTLLPPQGFTSKIIESSLTVLSSNAMVNLQFSPITYYNVTFSENGLPHDTNWTVTFGGSSQKSSSGNITFSMANGSYSYTVSSVGNYIPNHSSGSVTVNGNNVTVNITFGISPSVTKQPAPGNNMWMIYLGIGVAVAAGILASIIFLRRKR